jgi:hypothetical protein
MNATQLNARKMEIIGMLLDVDSEKVLADISSLIRSSLDEGAPCRFSAEQLRKRAVKANADIAAGRYTAHEDIPRKVL